MEVVVAFERPDAMLSSLFDGGSRGPVDVVATHLGAVRFEGLAFNRGIKRRRSNIPTVVMIQLGPVFAGQLIAAHVDKEK